MIIHRSLPVPLLLGFLMVSAGAQSGTAETTMASGLRLHVETLDGTANDTLVTRLPALFVGADTAPSPFLPPGPFRARWEGTLSLDLRTRLAFFAEGRGRVRIEVAGKVVLEGDLPADGTPLVGGESRVGKGFQPLLITYQSPPSGDSVVRVQWQGRDFIREPIPPAVLHHEPTEAEHEALRRFRGRELVQDRGCVGCHSGPDLPDPSPKARGFDAPDLRDLGQRLNSAWVAEWLRSPSALRPSARMPHLFHHDPGADAPDERPNHVAAYLESLSPNPTSGWNLDPEGVASGARTFGTLGCVGCHQRPDRTPDLSDDRISLVTAAQKFRPGALATFLQKPRAHAPNGRMPDFQLTAEEANGLEHWLRQAAMHPVFATQSVSGDAEQGRVLVSQMRCAACHEGLDATPDPAATWESVVAAATEGRGCVQTGTAGAQPDFRWSDADLRALQDFLRSSRSATTLSRSAPVAEIGPLLNQLRCNGCHDADGIADRWTLLVGEVADLIPPPDPATEEAKISQLRPSLNWMGDRLHGQWVARFLRGDEPRVRTWLGARMPLFAGQAEELAAGLAARHGFSMTTSEPVDSDPEMVEAGKFLVNADGFGCTACHGLNGIPPYATFEFAAPEFDRMRGRVRKSYFERWMWNPPRVEPRYRMPVYGSRTDGLTQQDEVFEGDATRQFEAMWQYLSTLQRSR